MRWLKRRLYSFIWFIAKLPFKLIYLFFCGLLSSGKRLSRDGYVLKNSKSGKYRYEHRMIAEKILGRRLESWEVVHHINGKRSDNRPENLCVMSRTDHDRYHRWYDKVFESYRRYPRRTAQLRKLTESFHGTLLGDPVNKKTGTG